MELFGRPGSEGKPEPFHAYSMRQAIEEGFILDVLKGYVTYDTAFKLEQQGVDIEVKSGKAYKKIFQYANLHPTSIGQKIAVIVEHFRRHVMQALNGQAKAMVVTDSRKAAVRYKKEFDKYMEVMGYRDPGAGRLLRHDHRRGICRHRRRRGRPQRRRAQNQGRPDQGNFPTGRVSRPAGGQQVPGGFRRAAPVRDVRGQASRRRHGCPDAVSP